MYHVSALPPDRVRNQLERLGVVGINELEGTTPRPRLAVNDWYEAAIGRTVEDSFAEEHKIFTSLKVADLSIEWGQWMIGEKSSRNPYQQPGAPVLRILDNLSCLSRFNDEKAWVEFVIRRILPRATTWHQVTFIGLTAGLHSDWVYKTLEGVADGVIDFKLKETSEEALDLMRIRTMRGVSFDRRWHSLKISESSEITLENPEPH